MILPRCAVESTFPTLFWEPLRQVVLDHGCRSFCPSQPRIQDVVSRSPFSQRFELVAQPLGVDDGLVPVLAACAAQSLRARVPAEPLLFRAAHPALGLSQGSRDRRQRAAEMFFAI